jgi:uncharacterized DUF497 family protein
MSRSGSRISTKHGYDFRHLTTDFFEAAEIIPARDGRFRAVGRFKDEALTVIFQRRGTEAVAVISMRPANRKERSDQ